MNGRKLRVLSLQPWHGGSHRQFADGWAKHSRHEWTTIGLPAKNWKWRMRHASMDLAQQVNLLAEQGKSWDIVFCTDMMNAAEFRALAKSVNNLPLVVYFHENQFAYPIRGKQQPDHHFLFTNLVSASVADQVWFNSAFNRESMLNGLEQRSDSWPDFQPEHVAESIRDKSRIVPPPIAFSSADPISLLKENSERVVSGEPLHLVWAARWEYDKNPDSLLKCLELLEQQRVPFRLSVIGEQADICPPAFELIREKFELQIENWGYQQSRDQYWAVLESADVVLSTANHEFFGLSIVEAISAGCWPLLPNRLAYPEVLRVKEDPQRGQLFLYQSTPKDLAAKIRAIHQDRAWNFEALEDLSEMIRGSLKFSQCAQSMDDLLVALI